MIRGSHQQEMMVAKTRLVVKCGWIPIYFEGRVNRIC